MTDTAAILRAAPATRFPLAAEALAALAGQVLKAAQARGATAAESEVSQAFGLSVTVRKGEVETIAYNRDKGIGVTVYVGARRGHASTADFSTVAIDDTVTKALTIARYTAEDPCAGLADPALLARSNGPELDLYHPWELSVEQAIALGQECEAAALARRPPPDQFRRRDAFPCTKGEFAYANTHGFCAGYASSRHGIYCAVIGDDGESMQRDDWYTAARAAGGSRAGRAGRPPRRRAHRASTGRAPADHARLRGRVRSAGGHRPDRPLRQCHQRRQSLPQVLLSARQPRPERVCAARSAIREEPHLAARPGVGAVRRRGRGDACARCRPRRGRAGLSSWAAIRRASSGSFRRATPGATTTSSSRTAATTCRRCCGAWASGLLVTELLGQGVNPVTGDYSRGAAGYWVEDGVIAYPVEEITIAGNLRRMYRDIVAVGNDVDRRGSRHCGSILIGAMMVAGN